MKKLKTKEIIALYILFTVALLIGHYFIITGTNDDAWFAQMLDQYSLCQYLGKRYNGWTSRLLIEILVVYLTRMNPWIWKALNIAVILLLVYECNLIWGGKNKVLCTAAFMVLLFFIPLNMLKSAGWIATSINYVWPITACIYTLVPLYKKLINQKVRGYEYIGGIILGFLGCNQEQVVAVIFVAYILYGAYCRYSGQKVSWYWWLVLAISFSSLVFALTCPGNASRSTLEVATWFPEFVNLGMLEKVLIGYLTTFSYYISCGEYNIIFPLLSFILMWKGFQTTRKLYIRGAVAYPFIVTTFWGLGGRIVKQLNITSRTYWLGLL